MSFGHEDALRALVRSCRGAGYTLDQTRRLGAHYVAELRIGTEIHEAVWRAEGMWPVPDGRWVA